MKQMNQQSKRAQAFIDAYNKSNKRSLHECYKTMSESKRNAEIFCKSKMLWEGGHEFRIMGYNQMKFTCGWKTTDGNLRVETADNSYIIK